MWTSKMTLAIASVVMPACAQRVADFNVLGNRAMTASVQRGARVTGKDCGTMILSIPVGVPDLEEAVDRALASDPLADMLVDVVVRTTAWWFGVGQICYVVEGNLGYVERSGFAGPRSAPEWSAEVVERSGSAGPPSAPEGIGATRVGVR
jgi:hypothetical protein